MCDAVSRWRFTWSRHCAGMLWRVYHAASRWTDRFNYGGESFLYVVRAQLQPSPHLRVILSTVVAYRDRGEGR